MTVHQPNSNLSGAFGVSPINGISAVNWIISLVKPLCSAKKAKWTAFSTCVEVVGLMGSKGVIKLLANRYVSGSVAEPINI